MKDQATDGACPECGAPISDHRGNGPCKTDAEIERLRSALHKIASAYPCSTAKDMARVASEALRRCCPECGGDGGFARPTV